MHREDLSYGKIAHFYDAVLTLSGFKRGVERFLARLELALPPRAKLLDAGCGSGLLAFWLLQRFPDAEVTAFDIDTEMLRAMERARDRGMGEERLTIAQGDLLAPERLTIIGEGREFEIPEHYFDGVFVSGALEHVALEEATSRLAKLLKPGGIFLNLGVRRNPAGAVLAMVWRFRPYTVEEMRRACERAGMEDIRVLRLAAEDFPANLSRIAIVARKS